jgi:hypothetical protein
LKNGDRLTGTLVSESTNRVVLSTRWAKEVVIPLAEIQRRETVPQTVATPASRQATNVIVAGVVPPATNAARIAAIVPKHWHGDIQVGADIRFSEKHSQLYYGRVKLTYVHPTENNHPTPLDRLRNVIDLNGSYGRTEGIVSANKAEGSMKTDFDLGERRRVFVYNLGGGGYDVIRKIDLRYEVGPGVGYHVVTRTNFILNTELGLNYQEQHFSDHTVSERLYYRLAEDCTWRVSPRLTFDEKFEFFPSENLSDYRLRFESNIRYLLLENVSFNFTLLDTYDTRSASSVSPNDLQIRSSIGLKF